MKAAKNALVSIVTLAILTGLSNTVFARTDVSVGIGLGYPAYHQGWYHHSYYGPGWGRGHHYPYGSTVVIGGSWWWPDYYYPDYYIVEPPPPIVVRERPPMVIEQQTPVVQPQTINEDTQKVFRELRFKKSEYLRMLEIGDKASRIKAIRELAGFTFDDKVRQTLEKVLLDDPDPELRVETAKALGELKNPKTRPALEKARIQDSRQEVRRAADQAIKKIEGN